MREENQHPEEAQLGPGTSSPGYPLVQSNSRDLCRFSSMARPRCKDTDAPTAVIPTKISFDAHPSVQLHNRGPPIPCCSVKHSFGLSTEIKHKLENTKRSSKRIVLHTRQTRKSLQQPFLTGQNFFGVTPVQRDIAYRGNATTPHYNRLATAIAAQLYLICVFDFTVFVNFVFL